jgi:hypothetical protein
LQEVKLDVKKADTQQRVQAEKQIQGAERRQQDEINRVITLIEDINERMQEEKRVREVNESEIRDQIEGIQAIAA